MRVILCFILPDSFFKSRLTLPQASSHIFTFMHIQERHSFGQPCPDSSVNAVYLNKNIFNCSLLLAISIFNDTTMSQYNQEIPHAMSGDVLSHSSLKCPWKLEIYSCLLLCFSIESANLGAVIMYSPPNIPSLSLKAGYCSFIILY